jgi:hypothetical protein
MNEDQKPKLPGGKIAILYIMSLLAFSILPWIFLVVISSIQGKSLKTAMAVVLYILIAAAIFLSIRSLRKGYRITGIAMLIIVLPLVVMLLLSGACYISLVGNIG